MLTGDDLLCQDTYMFKNSPESSGDDSFTSDYFNEHLSDEDFINHLSNELDIPLLLNPDLLSSVVDQSPDEILSDIKPSLVNESLKWSSELDELHQIDLSQFGPEAFPNIKAEEKFLTKHPAKICVLDNGHVNKENAPNFPLLKIEESSNSSSVVDMKCTSPSLFVAQKIPLVNNFSGLVFTAQAPQVVPQNVKLVKLQSQHKRYSLKSQLPYAVPKKSQNNNIIVVPSVSKNSAILQNSINQNNQPITSAASPKVIILDNIKTTVPVTKNISTLLNGNGITTTSVSSHVSNVNVSAQVSMFPIVDPKTTTGKLSPVLTSLDSTQGQVLDTRAFKRQQRMIKNRESACLSRKKRKDYVTSLENRVQQLEDENQALKLENKSFKEKITLLQSNSHFMQLPTKSMAKTLTVCAILCVISFNANILGTSNISPSNKFLSKSSQISQYDHHGRNLLWVDDLEDSTTSFKNQSNNLLPMCPMYVNQSENARLVSELHKLIGAPYNNSKELYENAQFDTRSFRKLKQKEKRLRNRYSNLLVQKSSGPSQPVLSKRSNRKTSYTTTEFDNSLQIYSPNSDQIYAEFFKAINRQSDTFYLVSLSPDHLLLPALNYNKTRRPKMSLLLPSMLPNVTSPESQASTISLMQIDCEVLDTHLLHIKHGVIPQHLRTQGNITQDETYNSSENIHSNSTTHDLKTDRNNPDSYKPYFMRKSHTKNKGN